MKLLLDTHIWIWTVLEPWRVTSEVTQEIARAEAVYLSPISIWELSLLAEKKTVVLRMDFGEWCQQAIREQALQEAPLTWDVAAEMPSRASCIAIRATCFCWPRPKCMT